MLSLYHRAPLLLFFDQPAEMLAGEFAHYVATSADVAAPQGRFVVAAIDSVVYQGIALDVQVMDAPQEFFPGNSVFCKWGSFKQASVLAIELGDNVRGGEVVAPIIKALLSLSQKVGAALGARAVYWRPADILSGFPYFSEVVSDYEVGGVFPVLPLIHFNRDIAGLISSVGLAFLCEQEIAFSPGILTHEEAIRRVIRVAHDLATNGPAMSSIKLVGLAAGECLQLEPDCTGRTLVIHVTSKMDP